MKGNTVQEYQGKVEIDGSSYPVSGVLEVREKNGTVQWSGFFALPRGAEFDSDEVNRGPHQLSLDDGRTGQIMLSAVDVDSGGTVLIDFDGQGKVP